MVRVGVAAPALRVADVRFNAEETLRALRALVKQGCGLVLFPELNLTGYTCGDLFYQQRLLEAAEAAVVDLLRKTRSLHACFVVGAPLRVDGRLYNAAFVLNRGRVVGIVPKSFIPNTGEFYEKRWFSPAETLRREAVVFGGEEVPVGTDLLFECVAMAELVFGVELCEDLWTVKPPSSDMALAGATLVLNPSASNELLGKSAYRRELVAHQSARGLCAYLYAGAGPGESSTDVVYPGHLMVAEYGRMLAEAREFSFEGSSVVADVDVQALCLERAGNSDFSSQTTERAYTLLPFDLGEGKAAKALCRRVERTPFIPADEARRAETCREIFNIQATGLAKRLKHTGLKRVVIGLSGGLDSTLAFLVCLEAFRKLRIPARQILAVTMPGMGTTKRTRSNAEALAAASGVTLECIPIHDVVRQHFRDIGHSEKQHDVTYENAQARERTQILMDMANRHGALVVGTGDLSEAALGWCTFNGDHMSMYHVNAGVPKTLVRYLTEWVAGEERFGKLRKTLLDVCATPISPELLPPDKKGRVAQKTEQAIGPYLLHDFFLYHVVRHHFAPRKVLYLAEVAFAKEYPKRELVKWLHVFYRRFFASQFKRSSMPDGPKVGTVALSPRGDWRMPSDAVCAAWLDELPGA